MFTYYNTLMDKTYLKNKPIENPEAYELSGDEPKVIYGAYIKDEYDNKRLQANSGTYIRHIVKDWVSGVDKEVFFCATVVQQPLLALTLLKMVEGCDFADTNELPVVYSNLLNKFKLTCDEAINHIDYGCLPIDGKHVDKLSEYVDKDVLKYNLTSPGWFNRFSPLNVYILY